MYRSILRRLLGLIALLFGSMACEHVNELSPIPDCAVQLAINIMQDAPELNTMGGYKCFTRATAPGQYLGYGGIVIFHGFDDIFYAFDLSCPHEAKPDITVSVDMGGNAECKSCNTLYDVGFGTGMPQSGISKHPLRKYKVIMSGYNLRVVR